MPPTRRHFLQTATALLAIAPTSSAWASEDLADTLARLERQAGGRLGVCLLDTGTGATSGHRMDERFALCSTFKLLLAAHVLRRIDLGEERLDRPLDVPTTLVANSPVTATHAGARMTVAELCVATVTVSDNTAANVLLGTVGGPERLTAFLRSIGDTVTRIDRIEPHLNVVDLAQGDERDSTTPASMAGLTRTLTLGDALAPESREQLVAWIRAATTGLARVRGALPASWNPGDKTGTGMDGPANDVVVAWPPGRAPLVVAAYYDRPGHSMEQNARVLKKIGRFVAGVYAG
jgi:beta-lactamase class A